MRPESSIEKEERVATRSGEPVLWIGVLGPPIVWALQMQLNYWLVRGTCARLSNTAFVVVTLISVGLLCLAGLSSLLAWRRVGTAWPNSFENVISRRRFMAVLGLLMTGMFLLVIIAQGIGAFVFHPCQL